MTDKQNDDKKWKDFLLKSSLPLEQLVSEKLKEGDFRVEGEYPYIRPNEQDIDTEFSVDLLAHAFGRLKHHNRRLNLLLECKYCYPGLKWVFLPYPRGFFIPQDIYCLQNHTEDKSLMPSIKLPNSIRGVELHNSGFDPNVISRGLNQLRYGMPNLVLQEVVRRNLARRSLSGAEEKYYESYICLILVTTADLYILRSGQNLDAYHSAKSLEDVADKVGVLKATQQKSPHFSKYCENLYIQYILSSKDPNLRIHHKISKTELEMKARYEMDGFIPDWVQIFVVNLDTFTDLLESLQRLTVGREDENDSGLRED